MHRECWFAALNVLTGKLVAQRHGGHGHQEFLKFLRRLDGAFPSDLALHDEVLATP